MDLNLPEDYGVINVRMVDGSCAQLDLYIINERLASIGREMEDKPIWEYLQAVQAFMTELGFPPVSGYVANAFVDGIGKAMAELKKKAGGSTTPALPVSTVPASLPCPVG